MVARVLGCVLAGCAITVTYGTTKGFGGYINLPRRTKRRLPKVAKQPLIRPTQKNIIWAWDFMHDTLYYSKPFRTLNIIDESNREVLTIEIDTSLPAGRVIRTLEQLGEIYRLTQAIRLDNGPELRSGDYKDH